MSNLYYFTPTLKNSEAPNSVNIKVTWLWHLIELWAVFFPSFPPLALWTGENPSANNLRCKSNFLLLQRICISMVFWSVWPTVWQIVFQCDSKTQSQHCNSDENSSMSVAITYYKLMLMTWLGLWAFGWHLYDSPDLWTALCSQSHNREESCSKRLPAVCRRNGESRISVHV